MRPRRTVGEFVLGVVNLGGVVLPIVDLAVRLGFPPTEPTPRHAIIVVECSRQVASLLVALSPPAPDLIEAAARVEQRAAHITQTRSHGLHLHCSALISLHSPDRLALVPSARNKERHTMGQGGGWTSDSPTRAMGVQAGALAAEISRRRLARFRFQATVSSCARHADKTTRVAFGKYGLLVD